MTSHHELRSLQFVCLYTERVARESTPSQVEKMVAWHQSELHVRLFYKGSRRS